VARIEDALNRRNLDEVRSLLGTLETTETLASPIMLEIRMVFEYIRAA